MLNLKATKKIISIILAVALCIGFVSVSASAKERLNYLLLGDSIAEGFGVKNPDEASYGKIIADTKDIIIKTMRLWAETASDFSII